MYTRSMQITYFLHVTTYELDSALNITNTVESIVFQVTQFLRTLVILLDSPQPIQEVPLDSLLILVPLDNHRLSLKDSLVISVHFLNLQNHRQSP